MGIFYFPCNFVYWKKVENHNKIKEILVPKIERLKIIHKNNKKGLTNASTNYGIDETLLLTNEENMIKHVVWDPLDTVINELNSRSNTESIKVHESVIGNSWYTYYELGGTFKYHTHIGNGIFKDGKYYKPTFSMIYILKDENNCNTTEFMETTHDNISTSSDVQTIFETSAIEDIKEGTVLIFPSSLYHTVNPVKIPGRITIAINIFSC
jgi:hypothetical protein